MGDYYSAQLTIGGNINSSILPELASIIEQEGMVDDSSYELSESEAIQAIHDAANSKQTLTLRNSEARNGTFEELESFLVKNRIAFDRSCDAYCEYDGEVNMYRPIHEGNHPENHFGFTGNQSGDAMVKRDDIIDIIKTVIASGNSNEDMYGDLDCLLGEAVSIEIEDLKPIVVVEG